MPSTNTSTSIGLRPYSLDKRQITPMIMHNPIMSSSPIQDSKFKPNVDYYEDVKSIKGLTEETLWQKNTTNLERKHSIIFLKLNNKFSSS